MSNTTYERVAVAILVAVLLWIGSELSAIKSAIVKFKVDKLYITQTIDDHESRIRAIELKF